MSAKYFDELDGKIKDQYDDAIIESPDADGDCAITISSGRLGEHLTTNINLRLLVRFVQHHFCDKPE